MGTPTTPPAANHAIDALTPPSSNSKESLLVNRVLVLLWRRCHGYNIVCNPWNPIRLRVGGYEELVRKVEATSTLRNFVDKKARLDYDSSAEQLVVRMPTPVHEVFIVQVVVDIVHQLRTLGSTSKPCASFARQIIPSGSRRFVFQNSVEPDPLSSSRSETTYIRHEPDASFAHEDAKYPGVVLEVSYSQKRGSVPRLAEDYILESNGNIRAVVGLDIEYRGSKKATLSVWCPQTSRNEDDGLLELVVHNEIDEQLFRNEDGTPVDDVSLQIPLSSIAPNRISDDQLLEGEEITISSSTLCQYLQIAESRSLAAEDGLEDSPPLRKRRRLGTSPEQLNSDDEAVFLALEAESASRAS